MQYNQLRGSQSPNTGLPSQMIQSQQIGNTQRNSYQNQVQQFEQKTTSSTTNYNRQQINQQQQQTLSQRVTSQQQTFQNQQIINNVVRENIQSNRSNQITVEQQQSLPSQQIINNQVIQNKPQSFRYNQVNVQSPQIIQNNITQSPVAPLSIKNNKSWSGQKPAFVEYLPPVFIQRGEPLIQQTVVEKPIQVVDLIQFEDIWNKRLKGLEDALAERVPVEPEPLELRAVQVDDSEKVNELQLLLFTAQNQLEDKDKVIIDLRLQLQAAIEQLEYEKLQSRNNQKYALTELELQIKNLQQTNANLQIDLKQTTESLQRYRIENNQLQSEKQYYKDQCDQKDELIGQLQKENLELRAHIEQLEQEISELRSHIEQLSEEVTTTQSVQTYEEEAKIWKKKFKELNDTYHACQEKLMIRDAEYESLLKSQTQQKVVTQTIIQSSSSSRKIDSDYLKNSLGTNEIKEIQKPLML